MRNSTLDPSRRAGWIRPKDPNARPYGGGVPNMTGQGKEEER